MERSLHWYIESLCILISTYTIAPATKEVSRKIIITNKDDLTKENATVKQTC